LLNDKTKGFGASQFSLMPGYDLLNNNRWAFSISYTHYFIKDYFSIYSSPVQNDFYTSLSYKKSWIKPGIAAGYSTGKYKQVFVRDSILGTIRRRLYDSATFNLRSFSTIFSAGHDFDWQNVFTRDDGLIFTSSFVLNFGSYNIGIIHKTNAPHLLDRLINRGRFPKIIASNFRAESVGMNMNLNYSIGSFSFSPRLYLDYYLPESDSDKFTQSFNFSVGYIF